MDSTQEPKVDSTRSGHVILLLEDKLLLDLSGEQSLLGPQEAKPTTQVKQSLGCQQQLQATSICGTHPELLCSSHAVSVG